MPRPPRKTKEEKLETRRAYRAAHREQIRATDARWRDANRDKKRAGDAHYRTTHADRFHAGQKAYRDSPAGRAYNVAYTTVYYAMPVNRLRNLVNGAFRRAQRTGLNWEAELRQHLCSDPPKECACCGVVLDYSVHRGRNNRDRSPSPDRLDNDKGYTIANIQVICMRCNGLKSNASIQELETLITYMKRTCS